MNLPAVLLRVFIGGGFLLREGNKMKVKEKI